MITPLLAGLLFGTVVDSVAVGGKGMAALVQVVKDPLSLFAQRSPGGRGTGVLLSTKGGHTAHAEPQEHVLTATRDKAPPAGAMPVADFAEPELPAIAYLGVPDSAPLLEGAPLILPSILSEGPVGSNRFMGARSPALFPGGIISGPLSPVDEGKPDVPPVTTPQAPPVQSAIPEPATWLTMIAGFSAIGFLLRRRAVRLLARC